MQESYSDAETFLGQMQAHRGALGTLPAEEPPADEQHYRVSANPFGVNSRVRLQDGTWLRLNIASVTGVGGRARPGEGLMWLTFATDEQFRTGSGPSRRPYWNQEWARFRSNAEALGTDEATASLYRANLALLRSFPTESAFIAAALLAAQAGTAPCIRRGGRGPLGAEPPHDPLGSHVRLAYSFKSGATLHQNWTDGQRVELSLDDPARCSRKAKPGARSRRPAQFPRGGCAVPDPRP